MAEAYKCDRCGKYGDGPAPHSVDLCKYYGFNNIKYTISRTESLCRDCYELIGLLLDNRLIVKEKEKEK